MEKNKEAFSLVLFKRYKENWKIKRKVWIPMRKIEKEISFIQVAINSSLVPSIKIRLIPPWNVSIWFETWRVRISSFSGGAGRTKVFFEILKSSGESEGFPAIITFSELI